MRDLDEKNGGERIGECCRIEDSEAMAGANENTGNQSADAAYECGFAAGAASREPEVEHLARECKRLRRIARTQDLLIAGLDAIAAQRRIIEHDGESWVFELSMSSLEDSVQQLRAELAGMGQPCTGSPVAGRDDRL